jgi:hypothetical protein
VNCELAMRKGERLCGKGEPPVVPGAPRLWTIGIQGCFLSVWGQGGTATSVVQLLDHKPIPLAGSQREGGCDAS